MFPRYADQCDRAVFHKRSNPTSACTLRRVPSPLLLSLLLELALQVAASDLLFLVLSMFLLVARGPSFIIPLNGGVENC
jgi:hypothetical protein